jgi:hypothetical protein
VYVERNAAFTVPLAEVRSAVVERVPEAANIQEAEEALKIILGQKEPQPVPEGGDENLWLRIGISLEAEVAKRLGEFLQANIGRILVLKLDGQLLLVSRVDEPISSNGFALFLRDTPNHLKTVLSPLKEKVVWK